MSAFSLDAAIERARTRTARSAGARAPRSDRGKSRMPASLQRELSRWLGGQERPPMREVLRAIAEACERGGFPIPARATVYAFLSRAPTPRYRVASLPPSVRATLHNLDEDALVPGPQIVHRAFNAGDLAAISFAASMPWLCLYQASEMRGFRPKSLALLRAVIRTRRIR